MQRTVSQHVPIWNLIKLDLSQQSFEIPPPPPVLTQPQMAAVTLKGRWHTALPGQPREGSNTPGIKGYAQLKLLVRGKAKTQKMSRTLAQGGHTLGDTMASGLGNTGVPPCTPSLIPRSLWQRSIFHQRVSEHHPPSCPFPKLLLFLLLHRDGNTELLCNKSSSLKIHPDSIPRNRRLNKQRESNCESMQEQHHLAILFVKVNNSATFQEKGSGWREGEKRQPGNAETPINFLSTIKSKTGK